MVLKYLKLSQILIEKKYNINISNEVTSEVKIGVILYSAKDLYTQEPYLLNMESLCVREFSICEKMSFDQPTLTKSASRPCCWILMEILC